MSPSPTSSPSSNNNDAGSSGRTLAIAVSLSIITLLLFLLLAIYILRKRRRTLRQQHRISAFRSLGFPNNSSTSLNGAANTSLESSHQNHRITPFGMPGGETPRFMHTPGANMRIASRRIDGAWDFADPRAPFTPTGVHDLENVPSPSPLSRGLLGVRSGQSSPSTASSYGGLSPNGPGTAFQFPPRSSSPLSTTTFSTTLNSYQPPASYSSAKEREAKRASRKAFDECEPNPDILPPPAYVYGNPHLDPHSPLSAYDQEGEWRHQSERI